MKLQSWLEVIDKDLPPRRPVTKDNTAVITSQARRFGGAIRRLMGKVWIDDDYAAFRKKVRSQS